jgi:hypothetical protein
MPKLKEDVPIAEVIRRRKKSGIVSMHKRDDPVEDIDEEIKRLEAELADTSDSDSDDDDDLSSGSESVQRFSSQQTSYVKIKGTSSSTTGGVLALSTCAEDTINPLPEDLLPKCKSKKLKIDSIGSDFKELKQPNTTLGAGGVNDGLRKAVEEVLSGYVARSSERIPFYCRVCAKTMANEEEFRAHKSTEFHKIAVQVEKKKTFCKVCRKQLTSIVQLQEHIKSKPHKERMEYVKAHGRNPKGKINDHGAARGEGYKRSDKDSRQWC